MNKAELANRLAARTSLSKAIAREAVDGVCAAIGAPPIDHVAKFIKLTMPAGRFECLERVQRRKRLIGHVFPARAKP